MTLVSTFLTSLLSKAFRSKVSDIHIEPYPEFYRIRFRIDGYLSSEPLISLTQWELLISCIKVLSKLDIAERRRPQDGTYLFSQEDWSCVIRVATFPSLHGEKLVMRLLDYTQQALSLGHLGLSAEQCENLDNSLNQEGFFLVTGPTGSGKTTTVHALLLECATDQKNCVTLEDPVEYRVPGVTQTAVHPEIGLTFEAGLRSLLRQDPDIIMIGEIRDQPTARVALQAALTGHQVFSTLHTSHAVGALMRLHTLGVDRSLIASSVRIVIAQRLVRTLCAGCRAPVMPTPEQMVLLTRWYKPLKSLYSAGGCGDCNEKGYQGRTGVFQLLELTRSLRELFISGHSEDVLIAEALNQGMKTILYDASLKLEAGTISFDEWRSILNAERSW